jgi:hypothetical protein
MVKFLKRFRLSTLVVISFALLSGCSSPQRVVLTPEKVIHARLNGNPSIGLLVISDERKGLMWYRTATDFLTQRLKNVPATGFHEVWQVSVSPDDKYLAVISVGEGHPIIEVFHLGEVLISSHSTEENSVNSLLTIDPYPGYVWILGWRAPSVLRVASDMPLERLDKSERRVPIQDIESEVERRKYLWDISMDTIQRE